MNILRSSRSNRFRPRILYGDDSQQQHDNDDGHRQATYYYNTDGDDEDIDDGEDGEEFLRRRQRQVDDEEQQQQQHDSNNERYLKKAEQVEKTITGAIDVAERSNGSLLYFQTSTKARAIEMGRRVSSLRSLEDFQHHNQQQQQQQRSYSNGGGGRGNFSNDNNDHNDAVSLTDSVASSYRSMESLPMFLKVPKVDPTSIRSQSWDSLIPGVDDENQDAPLGANNRLGNHGQGPRESLTIVGVGGGGQGGDFTHRSWAKLRQEEADKKRRNRRGLGGRRRFGMGGGGIKMLRQASNRLTMSSKSGGRNIKNKTLGRPIDLDDDSVAVDQNDSDTSPEDVGGGDDEVMAGGGGGDMTTTGGGGYRRGQPPHPEEEDKDYDDGFVDHPSTDGGLERQNSWWEGINFNTVDEEDDIVRNDLPTAQSERSAFVPVMDDGNIAPKGPTFEAREVSVEVSLQGRLANNNKNNRKKNQSRSWTRSFRRKKDKSSKMVTTTMSAADPEVNNRVQKSQDYYYSRRDQRDVANGNEHFDCSGIDNEEEDDIALTERPLMQRSPGCTDSVGVLALGDAFVDWTLEACEPLPVGRNYRTVQDEQEEIEILCGESQCVDAYGSVKSF